VTEIDPKQTENLLATINKMQAKLCCIQHSNVYAYFPPKQVTRINGK